jgi:CheY-like chemotaxis protein
MSQPSPISIDRRFFEGAKVARVLLVDDEVSWRENFGESLEALGCVVDGVNTAGEASTLISRHPYDAVIADVVLPENPPGDIFLIEEHDRLRDKLTAAVSAWGLSRINNYALLQELGIPVFNKEQSQLEDLVGMVARRRHEKVDLIVDVFKQRSVFALNQIVDASTTTPEADLTRYMPSPGLVKMTLMVRGLLTDWLGAVPASGRKSMVYDGEAYSAQEMLKHIEDCTEVGVRHMEMFISVIRRVLKMEERQ